MPAEETYQSRVMPQAAAPMPMARPENFGAGVADAVGQLGDTIHRTQLRDHQIQRELTADRELTEASAKLADRTSGLRASTARLRAEYTSGHVLAVEELLQQDRDAVLDGITDRRVRNQVERQLNDQDARVRSEEEVFALGKGIERNGELAKRTLSTLDNQIAVAEDPIAALADGSELWSKFAGGLGLIDEIQREALLREGNGRLTTSMLERLGASNPDGAEALLKTGRFNDLLTEQQMGRAQQAITLGRRAQDVAAREAQQEQVRAAREAQKAAADRLEAIKVRIDNDDPPSTREISTAIAAAREAAVPEADLLRAGYLAEDAERAKFLRGMSTSQLEARAGPLRARQDAGQLDAAGTRELEQLERTLTARDRKDEVELGTLWRSGPDGQDQVLGQLRAMPRSERLRSAQFDPRVGILASLDTVSADAARQGNGIRKARPKDFMPVEEDGKEGNPALARDTFNRLLGPAMVNSLGQSYDDVLNTSLDLFVGSQAKGGSGGGWSEAGFAKAVRIVFGSSKRRDGKYQGGIDYVRGRITQLPDLWTAAEFDLALSRQDFAASGAIYSNGQSVTNADVLRNYRATVESEADDGTIRYRLEDASGRALRSKSGGNFNLIVTRSPRGR